ncbi:hypothetical protein TIFTF001_006474 [Ficus carica]|uniref:Dof zinc finger protein n=1 Tax=Ficus carica TaxID=3494 RepID=A0AA88CW25_FICCA|nr:hypothetical protein TIFTF001_006474 [Ficus carica]
MQDPATFQPMKAHFPEQEQLKCPRCDSTNTKFCYYNNYNLSQPRHFCKNCRRYWTKGGALRNIPVGGGSRKNTKRSSNSKRSSSSSSTASSTQNPDSQLDPTRAYASPADPDRRMLDIPGSFSSLLTSNAQFGGLLEGINHNGSGVNSGPDMNSDPGPGRTIGMEVQSNGNSESYWGGGNGWPDLAIYTPGSSFQ